MKKYLAFLMSVVLLLSFTACGAPITPDVTTDTFATTAPTEVTATTEATTIATETETEATTAATEAPAEPVLMYQAHRGVSTDFPENTIPAFQGAIDQGYKFIELDPNFTKDNQCVLMHDNTINRTCRLANGASFGDSKIALNSITYEQLSKYDAGIFKGEQFKGTKVPLLSEVAELVKDTGVALKLDNKIWNYTDEQIEIILWIASTSGADIGITCKTIQQMEFVATLFPGMTIHYDGGISKALLDAIPLFSEGRDIYIWVGIDSATAKICQQVKEVGYLGLWTLSTEEQLQKAIGFGADVIETNGELKP